MGLLTATDLRLSLDRRELLPGDEVTVRLETAEDMDRVRSARLELGFVNAFRYRWAGRPDAAMVGATEAAGWIDPASLGTTHGTDKEAHEWVPVLHEDLPLVDGRIAEGERSVRFRLPSWSPPSSRELAQWETRVRVERARARDGEARAELTVLARRPSAVDHELETIRLDGGITAVEIGVEEPAVRAGHALRGFVSLTPTRDVMPVTVTLALARHRLSHPVVHTAGGTSTRDIVRLRLAKQQPLGPRATTRLPFELEVPADAPPTGEAPNSSVRWYLEAWAMYAGLTTADPTEKVRREVVVFNAPDVRMLTSKSLSSG